MKFLWIDDGTIQRCDFERPVVVNLRAWGGGEPTPTQVKNAGYVIKRTDFWVANTYGSVNPDSYLQEFDNIDEAKRYVETQALVGIATNKLTR